MAYQMLFYLSKKAFYVFITVLLILSFNFVLFRMMPGDVSGTLIPKGVSPETRFEPTSCAATTASTCPCAGFHAVWQRMSNSWASPLPLLT